MNLIIKIGFIALISIVLCNCKQKQGNSSTTQSSLATDAPTLAITKDNFQIPESLEKDSIFNLNLNQDLSGKSLPELRILRSSVYARHGYCFMEADLRGYFVSNTKWYDTLMQNQYDRNYTIELNSWLTLSEEEKAFVDKTLELEKEKIKENFKNEEGQSLANPNNVVNLFDILSTEDFNLDNIISKILMEDDKKVQFNFISESEKYKIDFKLEDNKEDALFVKEGKETLKDGILFPKTSHT